MFSECDSLSVRRPAYMQNLISMKPVNTITPTTQPDFIAFQPTNKPVLYIVHIPIDNGLRAFCVQMCTGECIFGLILYYPQIVDSHIGSVRENKSNLNFSAKQLAPYCRPHFEFRHPPIVIACDVCASQ